MNDKEIAVAGAKCEGTEALQPGSIISIPEEFRGALLERHNQMQDASVGMQAVHSSLRRASNEFWKMVTEIFPETGPWDLHYDHERKQFVVLYFNSDVREEESINAGDVEPPAGDSSLRAGSIIPIPPEHQEIIEDLNEKIQNVTVAREFAYKVLRSTGVNFWKAVTEMLPATKPWHLAYNDKEHQITILRKKNED